MQLMHGNKAWMTFRSNGPNEKLDFSFSWPEIGQRTVQRFEICGNCKLRSS